MAKFYEANLDSPGGLTAETEALLTAEIEDYIQVSARQEGFPLLLSLGERALAICRQRPYSREAVYRGRLWTSQPIPVGSGIDLTVEAITSHRKIVADSASGPYFKDVTTPRRTAQVAFVAVKSNPTAYLLGGIEQETWTRVGDRQQVETSMPELADWETAADYIGQCLTAIETRTKPELGQVPLVPQILLQRYE